MKKRWLSMLLTAVMVGSTLTTAMAADEDKVITFWNFGMNEPDHTIIDRVVANYNENSTSGYTIEPVFFEADAYKEKILIAMSSGECPDMYESWAGGPMNEYVNAGFAQPLTDLYEASEWKDKIMDATISMGKYNDELYGVGWMDTSVAGIYYNKEIFEKYGLEEPTTISELEAVCDTLVENGVIPFTLANSEKWTGSMFFMYLATRKGGLEPFNAAVEGTGSFEDECFIWAGQKIQEWVEKGYFPEGVNSLSEADGQAKQLFYTEAAAMRLMGSWDTGAIMTDSPDLYSKLGWFPFPAEESAPEVDPSIMIGSMGQAFINFNCTGEKLEAAFELMNYFFDDANIQASVEAGAVTPVKGVEQYVGEDQEVTRLILEKVGEAKATQLWYDQYLPPSVTQAHLDGTQGLFGLTTTPEEAAAEFQAAMVEYNNNK